MTEVSLLGELTFLRHVRDSGRIDGVGLSLLIFAAVLGLIWLILAICRRRRFVMLGCCTVILAACGYVCADWAHVSLNLRMHDVQKVRDDCQLLMRNRPSLVEHPASPLFLSESELPSSLARLGAREARVDPQGVAICLLKIGGWGSQWGVAYIPEGSPVPPRMRSTWYHNLYEYRSYAE